MGIERKTAHSYLTRYQAELAANAAADYAKNLIYRTISDEASKVNDPTNYNSKVNFITWTYSPDAGAFAPFYTGILSNAIPRTPNPAIHKVTSVDDTVWLASDPANANADASSSTGDLTSNTTDPSRFATLPADQRCNINFKLGSENGVDRYWIDQSSTPYYVGWVDLPFTSPNPSTTNQLKIRYAFWVDDEMGRADVAALSHADQKDRKGDDYHGLPEDLTILTGADAKAFSDADTALVTSNRRLARLSPLSIRQLVTSSAVDLLKKNPITTTASNSDILKQPASNAPSVWDLIPYGPLAGQPKINLNDAVTQASSPQKFVWDLTNTAENPDSTNYTDFSAQPRKPSIKTALPEYYNRKNSPPGNVLRIAASIRDYISPDTYPTLAPELNTRITTAVSKVYDFVTAGYQGSFPSEWNLDWADISPEKRWYGIKGSPLINAVKLNCKYNSKKSYTGEFTFYLWNPTDRPVTVNNTYVMVYNSPFQSVNGATGPAGQSVDGLPYFRFDVFTIPNTSLPPRAQTAILVSKNYTINKDASSNTASASNMGWVLFQRDANGTIRVFDAFRNSSGKTYTLTTGVPGGGQTGSANVWDTKDRRQSLWLLQTEWSSAASAVSGNLANFQELARWYDQPGVSADPIMHIASGPMKSLGELGNIFDPVNDVGFAVSDSYARALSSGGNTQSRGGKVLTVGQFDEFFDKLQGSTAPKNPQFANSSGWSSYEKYLRFADTALFDIFTLRTASDSQKLRPLNVNSLRPGPVTEDTVSPFSTYVRAMNSVLGSSDALGPGVPGMTKTLSPTSTFLTAARQRLTGPNWKDCHPFRNVSDLMLLGFDNNSLKADSNLQTNSGKSLFSAKSDPFYVTGRTTLSVNMGSGTAPITALSARNNQRQAAFSRLAEQTTFRSYRYRIYAVGQVYRNGQPNKPLSTVYQTYIYDLNPIYDATIPVPSNPSTPANNVVFYPQLQRVEEN